MHKISNNNINDNNISMMPLLSLTEWKARSNCFSCNNLHDRGWSGGAMVLGKLPVSGRPTNLD